jgi:murein DD-endopeptidase MepM/ murein hydrolase activator NlpD
MKSARIWRSALVLITAMGLLVGVDIPLAWAQQGYSGVFRSGNDGYYLWVGVTWPSFVAKWQELSGQGLRLVDLETDVVNGTRRYTGVWRGGNDKHYLWVGVDWSNFASKWLELSKQGLRLIDFETYVDGNTRKFAGVWRAGNDAHYLWVGVDWQNFVSKWQELSGQGLRLIDLETYVEGGQRKFAGVWRAGNDAHYLWVGVDWGSFVSKWLELSKQGLRLIDFEAYSDDGGKSYRAAGVFRAGSDAHGLWVSADFENFVAAWHYFGNKGLRLTDIERYPSCSGECANQVVAPTPYNYFVTGGDRFYRWPVDSDSSGNYVRLTAVHFPTTPFLTLPFSDGSVNRLGTWRYGNGGWHHAIDYARPDSNSFDVVAAAPGEVEYVGWDNWSGNTVIVSHTVAGVSDAFRTLYMHLRDGADADCDRAWNNTVPTLTGQNLTDYLTHLNQTGCVQNPASRNLDSSHWGTNAETIPVVVGQTVARGQMLARAGNTGPGGKRGAGGPNTHLHLFVARRDPTNDEFYFIDPYGIYSGPNCYPAAKGGKGGTCARYPNIWQ